MTRLLALLNAVRSYQMPGWRLVLLAAGAGFICSSFIVQVFHPATPLQSLYWLALGVTLVVIPPRL